MNKLSTSTAMDNASGAATIIGIDLAKHVFALDGINGAGKPILVRRSVRRDQVLGRSRICHLASSAWKRPQEPITGQAHSTAYVAWFSERRDQTWTRPSR